MIDHLIIQTAGPPRPTRARVRDRYRLPVVEATILTNDGAHNYDFDAAPWLKIASDAAIARLANEEWGGTATADDVAFVAANDDPMVASILGYVLASAQRGDNVYFNVYVDVEAALSWLEQVRPKSYALIIAQEIISRP
jgi:hypothetical protein